MPHSRLECSTISFRHLAIDEALAQIADLGFPEIDLGAMPPHRYGGVTVRPSSVSAYHGE